MFWMKFIADRSFSLLSSGKVDASLCIYCENASCTYRFFVACCYAVFLFILGEGMFSSLIEKLFSLSGTFFVLSFATCDLAIVQREP